MAWGITRRDHRRKNAEPKRTVSYSAARDSMRILELENRCTGNRTVGSNPTLFAKVWLFLLFLAIPKIQATNWGTLN
jgi:hypothetical protein